MKPFHLVIAATGAVAALKALQWWRGYSVDVTAGLGPFLPVAYLVIATTLAAIAVIAILRMFRSTGSKADRLTLLSVPLLVSGLLWVVPSFTMLGFKTRMGQFGASEFQALADSMRAAADPKRRGDLLLDPILARTLADEHPILRVGTRPKGYANSQGAQIRWGGGLTGAFAVDIWNGETEPPVSADAVDPTPLYSNVRLVWIF